MFTRNFDHFILSYLMRAEDTGGAGEYYDNNSYTMKDGSGHIWNINAYPASILRTNTGTNMPNTYSGYCYMLMGSTAYSETYNDYSVNSYVSYVSSVDYYGVNGYDSTKGKFYVHNYKRLRNGSSSATVVIREVLLISNVTFKNTTGTSTTTYPFLMFRKVLDEPVTLNPGEEVEVNLKFYFKRFNQPN